MRVELDSFGDVALLDLCASLTMNRLAHGDRLGPFGYAIEIVLWGIHRELCRRWQGGPGTPVAIEFPHYFPATQAHVAQGFTTFQELFRGRVCSDDTLASPFILESLRLAQMIVLAVSPTSELRN